MTKENVFVSGFGEFTFSNCITCGVVYSIPQSLWDHQRKSGGYHYCPNGHSQGWSKEASEDEKVRRERDRLKQQLAQKDDEIKRQREETEAAERRASAARGQATKLKNRASKGVCPCCNRHFTNLERHMATKHPTFTDDDTDNVISLGGKRA